MLELLSFEKVESAYNQNNKNLLTIRSIWDNYSGLVPDTYTIPSRLSEYFSTYPQAKYYRPLGDFKDIEGWEDAGMKEIYEHWCALLTEKRFSKKLQKDLPMLKVIEASFEKSLKYIQKDMDASEISEGFSCMLYRCAFGVEAEIKTMKLLKTLYKPYKNVEIVAAPASDEGKDIDAYLQVKGINKVCISIKNGHALSTQTIETKRRKGKVLPEVYVGLKNDEELDFIYAPYTENGEFVYDSERRKKECLKKWKKNA